MNITVEVPKGDPELMAWCREQGFDPSHTSPVVTVHPGEGEVTLRKFLVNEQGRRYVDPLDRTQAAMEEFRFRPTRPLPFNP